MKKVLAILVGLMLLLSFTACSSDNGNADQGNDGVIDDAGNAVNDVLDGAENAVDDVTGSDGGSNSNNNNMGDNNTSGNTNSNNNN